MSSTRVCTSCSLEKPLDAFYKDKTKRGGYRPDCKVCKRATSKAYSSNNRESESQRHRAYYQSNKKGFVSRKARRRAAKLHADVPWADQGKIDFVYHCRDVINKVYKGNCEVDHIEPLQGKHVCGLHVHNNLQLLSAKANRSKGARRKR
jgi:hypothetical protein